jgi:hypothetical protein
MTFKMPDETGPNTYRAGPHLVHGRIVEARERLAVGPGGPALENVPLTGSRTGDQSRDVSVRRYQARHRMCSGARERGCGMGRLVVNRLPAAIATVGFVVAILAVTSIPVGATVVDNELLAVSCSASSACTAVGESNGRALVERWNGLNWQVQSGASGALDGVSCPSSTDCIAVGQQGLADKWDGTSWTVESTPLKTASLVAVSCPTTTYCMAVGSLYGTDYTALAERWDGLAWTTLSTPSGRNLWGVSCPAANDCTAVGSDVTGLDLIQHWNGATWKTTLIHASLNGVSCKRTSACTAVGPDLAEQWNGSSWTAQSIPLATGSVSSVLNAASCPTTSVCTVVGHSRPSTGPWSPLAERWNGTTWAVQSTPRLTRLTTAGFELLGVSCPSASDCTAVGYYEVPGPVICDCGSNFYTLAERWNGTAWHIQTTP